MKKETSKWLVVFNWKMNPLSVKAAKILFVSTKKAGSGLTHTETVICPPFVYLSVSPALGTRISLGAQDLFWEEDGAHTGSVSYLQLKHMGVRYSIVGHSERRALGESGILIQKKMKAALLGSIVPILCVGEEVRDEHGKHLQVIRKQIEEAVEGLPKTSMRDIVVAYEPLWAIGKGKREATPQEIFEVVIYIKKVLSDLYGAKSIPPTKILYGGSVDERNAESILRFGGVDGLLVGRASLDPKSFTSLLKTVDVLKK